MASIFQGILHRFFQVSIFIKSTCRDSIANDKWPQLTRPQSTELSGLEAMLESYHKLQSKPKTVPEFKDALQLTWFSLYRRKPLTTLRKNTASDCRHVCHPVGGQFKHVV